MMRLLPLAAWVLFVSACSLDRAPSHATTRRGQTTEPSGTGGTSAPAAGTGSTGALQAGAGLDATTAGTVGTGASGTGASGTGAASADASAADSCGGCDDGVFCNGAERCMPGALDADARGCVVTPSCDAGSSCNEATHSCDAVCVATGSFETCDGIDNDCNGKIDDGSAALSCLLPNTLATCSAGHCVVSLCSSGYADCDNLASNGCERRLDTIPGDCSTSDCSGAQLAKPSDTPIDDGNPCTIESCNGSTPTVTLAKDGTTCSPKTSGSGKGTCAQGVCN